LRRKCFFVAQGNLSTSTAKPFRTWGGKERGANKVGDGRGCRAVPQLRAETQEAGTATTRTLAPPFTHLSLSLSPLRRAGDETQFP
jgi:hypothetical protein